MAENGTHKRLLAIDTLLEEPEEISDGLEAELYALRDRLHPMAPGGSWGGDHRGPARKYRPMGPSDSEYVSTRVEGAEPPVILLTAKATMAAGTACLLPAVSGEGGNLRHCNLSGQQNRRAACGKVIVPGHLAASRRAAEIGAGGYQPGSIERGLTGAFTQDVS